MIISSSQGRGEIQRDNACEVLSPVLGIQQVPVYRNNDLFLILIGKDPDAGRDWGQEEKGMTEDEMAGWHHQLDGHEFE